MVSAIPSNVNPLVVCPQSLVLQVWGGHARKHPRS